METVPFDLERWKAGELALDVDNNVTAEFSWEEDLVFCYKLEGDTPEQFSRTGRVYKFNKKKFLDNCEDGRWVMKPIEQANDGWTPHDGGPCPLPLGVTTFEVKRRNGQVHYVISKENIHWSHLDKTHLARGTDIIAWRIPDSQKTIATKPIEIDDGLVPVMDPDFMPLTLAEIRARKPKEHINPPVREIGQREMLRIAGEVMEGKVIGSFAWRWENEAIARLMK